MLLDSSFVVADPAPLGIHRVVAQYAFHGAAFAAWSGIDFVVVECTADGAFARREGPLVGPAPAPPAAPPVGSLSARVALKVLRYASRVISAGGLLAASLLPVKPLRRGSAALARMMDALASAARSDIAVPERQGDTLVPGAGDILFCPGFWHEMDFTLYERAQANGAEVVFLVHDILPMLMPTFYQYPWRRDFHRAVLRALDMGGYFYAVSGRSLEDLRAFAAQCDMKVRGAVAYNGFSPADERPVADPAALDEEARKVLASRPWLMVGTVEPKKGHRDAIATFEMLWQQGYTRPLVIIGRLGWLSEDMPEIICGSPWFGRRLFWYQNLGDAGLAAHYEQAHALLFGSLAEGFGLPPLEAAARGLPVLARDIPVVREVLGPNVRYFSGPRDLRAAVLALEDESVHAATRCNLAAARWYSWRDVVQCVMADLLQPAPARSQGGALMARLSRHPLSGPPTAEAPVAAEMKLVEPVEPILSRMQA
ncbi:glycosyltransferase family 1 protein [Xanthobacter sp. DSM 24535]|uniref:glycosyltransferase family 4 protein n=1 Tax=Roseixanthobacter psychrophilus TaxID=3119917 RepID=UPI003728725E